MVTDARGHEVPADSDMWGYREDMEDFSASVADVRSVADQDAAEAAIAELTASDIDPAGTVWWLANPGGLYTYDGTALVKLTSDPDLATALKALPIAMTAGSAEAADLRPNNAKSVTVTFPTGLFTSEPYLSLGMRATTPGERAVATAYKSASSVQIVFGYTGASSSITLRTDWTAAQIDPPSAAAFSAFARSATPLTETETITVTCPTEGCTNQGVPIEIPATWTNEDTDETQPVDAVQCGVCNADITATEEAS